MLTFIPNFDEIRYKTNKISKKRLILKWRPSMTSEVIHQHIKNVRLYNISIPINCHQHKVINECGRKNFSKIHRITERRKDRVSFRSRKNYVLYNLLQLCIWRLFYKGLYFLRFISSMQSLILFSYLYKLLYN